ncbi:MAG: selenocysteine-specific translation elongation factor, partial [Candidatus Lokiarchaeota archaeon]|nr:selenocysteine-specific translation elongation factor [Candidatus Lokiarchaeota archaeon]
MYNLENKIPIHIGLFGHIDSGKTSVAGILSEFISTAGIDAHPQSKERGITIDLGFTSLILDDYLITLVDGPGHADLIKISASSVEIIDLAVIVID